jgi:hypothetical protein
MQIVLQQAEALLPRLIDGLLQPAQPK